VAAAQSNVMEGEELIAHFRPGRQEVARLPGEDWDTNDTNVRPLQNRGWARCIVPPKRP